MKLILRLRHWLSKRQIGKRNSEQVKNVDHFTEICQFQRILPADNALGII